MVVDWLITGRFVSIAADTCTQQLWELTESFSITAWLDAVYVARRLLVLGLQAVLALSRCLHHASASHMMTSVRVISAMLACSLSNVIATIHRTPARTGHMWVTFWCRKDHSMSLLLYIETATTDMSCSSIPVLWVVTLLWCLALAITLLCSVMKWHSVQVDYSASQQKTKIFPIVCLICLPISMCYTIHFEQSEAPS